MKIGAIGMFIIIGLTACNNSDNGNDTSGGDKKEPLGNTISSRNYVFIFYNYPPSSCDAEIYTVNNNIDVIASVESNNVTCETYGKQDNGRECGTMIYRGSSSNKSCVIGYNIRSNRKVSKVSEDSEIIMMEDIKYTGISIF